MNSIQKNAFMFINSCLGWPGITVLPLCAFYASYLQQKSNCPSVSAPIAQASIIYQVHNAMGLIRTIRCSSPAQICPLWHLLMKALPILHVSCAILLELLLDLYRRDHHFIYSHDRHTRCVVQFARPLLLRFSLLVKHLTKRFTCVMH